MTRARLAAAAALALCLPARAGLPARFGGEVRLALPAAPGDLDPARAESAAELLAARAVHATLVEADASGALRPGLLLALPEAEPGGRAFRLRLRPGLRFHSGAPILAADVAASLERLASPAPRSPHRWIVLPVKGAEEVRAGRAAALAGVQVLSDTELRVERGTLDARARTTTDEMCFAAAQAMANHVGDRLAPDFILPNMDDWEVFPKEAAAVAMKAIEQGIARMECTYEEEFARASKIIKRSRDMTQRLMEEGLIAEPPEDDAKHDVDLETIKSAY